ncbi:MAG: hypothetical protein LJE68_15555 [Rhodobacter sp.]|nr:hypothetical protein [Rhodobacter sp.]
MCPPKLPLPAEHGGLCPGNEARSVTFWPKQGAKTPIAMWSDFEFGTRTLGHLFQWRGPALVLFWLALWAGLETPSPLAAALGLWLVLRIIGNLANFRRAQLPFPALAWCPIAVIPLAPLLLSDGWLMVLWSAWTVACGAMLWRWPDLRKQKEMMRPPPIGEAEYWMDIRAATLLATGGIGLALSLTGEPAIWMTGFALGAAAMDLTGILCLRTRGRI